MTPAWRPPGPVSRNDVTSITCCVVALQPPGCAAPAARAARPARRTASGSRGRKSHARGARGRVGGLRRRWLRVRQPRGDACCGPQMVGETRCAPEPARLRAKDRSRFRVSAGQGHRLHRVSPVIQPETTFSHAAGALQVAVLEARLEGILLQPHDAS